MKGRAVVQTFMSNDAESKASCKCLVWAAKRGSMVLVQTTKQRYIQLNTNDLKLMILTLVALKETLADVLDFKFEIKDERPPATPMRCQKMKNVFR